VKRIGSNINDVRLKGSALFYAIVLSLLIGLVLFSIISLNYFSSIEFEINRTQPRLISNCFSAEHLLYGQFSELTANKWKRLYEIDDETYIMTKPWGVYEIGLAKSVFRGDSLEHSFLFGNKWNDDNVAIHLKSGTSGLQVAGNTKIQGDVKVPGGRVKPAFIGNRYYEGDKVVYGNIYDTEKIFPEVSNKLCLQLKEITPSWVSQSRLVVGELKDSVSASFHQSPVIFFSADSVSITNQSYSGNIILASARAISIGKDASLNNVIITAPKVYVSSGFKGALQCFGSEKIEIQEDVTLNYPSSLILNGNGSGRIEIMERAILEGSITALKDDSNEEMDLYIRPNSTIKGQIICEGTTHLKGAVIGQVITKEFGLKTGSGYYKNHVLDGSVNVIGLPEWFCGPSLQRGQEKLQHITQL